MTVCQLTQNSVIAISIDTKRTESSANKTIITLNLHIY